MTTARKIKPPITVPMIAPVDVLLPESEDEVEVAVGDEVAEGDREFMQERL